MSQTNKPTMRPFSVRIYDDTRELYEELRGECTHDNFISTLLEGYQNPRKIEVPQEADQNKIKELTQLCENLEEQNAQLVRDFDVLEKNKNLLAQNLNENKNKIFFDLDERIEKILKEVQKRIKEKQNLDITDKNVLFYVGVRDGYLKL